LDGLPIYDGIKYIIVARDGRDACLSFHNHGTGFTPEMLAALDKVGLGDDLLGIPYPRLPADPAEYFHQWLTESRLPGQTDGRQNFSYFDQQNTYWAECGRPNLLMAHYADMKRDLLGEMKRIAAFLEIDITPSLWPELVEAASFETMKRQGNDIAPAIMGLIVEGKDRFFHKGETGRWKDIFRAEDLALYDRMAAAKFSPDCARWLAHGRLG
jgi:aryl sulfotransferase